MAERKIRLIHLLTALVLVSIMGASVVLCYASYMAEKKSLYDVALKSNYETAQRKSAVMNKLFKSMKKSLQTTAENLADLDSADALQEQLDYARESNNYFNSLFIADQMAYIKSVSPSCVGIVSSKLTSEAAVKALRARVPTVSEPYMSLTNKLIVLMTYPIFDSKGDKLGYLGGTIYLEENNVLNDIFGENTFSETGSHSYVVDMSGNLIFHPELNRLGSNVQANPVVWKLMKGSQGYERVTNTKGVPYLAGYAAASEIGWGIVVQTPDAEIKKETRKLLVNEIVWSLPFFIIILIVTVLLAKKLSAPFTALTETAKSLYEGSIVKPLPGSHWNYEAYHLNRTIGLAIDSLQQQAKQLSDEALTDSLTGLFNRRAMDARLAEWVQEERVFSVIALDIDHFKNVNDTYGHPVGDEVLKFLALKLMLLARKHDCCCRYGGEEFMVILPDTGMVKAYLMAEIIRRTVEMEVSPAGVGITVSLGVAVYPKHAASAMELIQAADQALYTAKRRGRNCTVIFDRSMLISSVKPGRRACSME